jgi:flagellar motor switch protein FliM
VGEVLSQNEIDSLLAALNSGEIDAEEMSDANNKQVRNYDFKRQTKFSKEHLRTLEIIYEHYGRLLSTSLPVYLRKSVQVSVVSSEAIVYSEFTNALFNPVILGVVNFQPLGGSIIVEMATKLGYAMIDRMLGGEGEPLDRSRDFTEIEISIIEKMMVVCMQLMREPWKNVVDINPMLERIETNSQFAQMISPNDMIAIVTLNVRIGDVEGYMNICLPFVTLESVMDRLNTKFWYANMQEQKEEDLEEYIEALIKRVDVPVRAVLGKTDIPITEFINIQVGDVIRLNTDVEQDLKVYVGNIEKFTALPGSSKDKYAVRVTSVIREEE